MPRAAQVPGSKESGGKEAPRHLLSRPDPPWEHGEGSVHHPLWTCLDVTDRGQTGCWELRSSSPGTTQSSPSLVSATNHVGGGPVSPLRRQTAQAEPPRSSASTARPVSTATPRGGGGWSVGKALRGEPAPSASWFLRLRRRRTGSSSRDKILVLFYFLCIEFSG